MHSAEWYEKRDLDAFLAKLGPEVCYVIKQTTKGYGESGHADRIAGLLGAFWAFELKPAGRELKPVQQRRIDAARKAGNLACGGTADECIEELTRWLTAHGVIVRE